MAVLTRIKNNQVTDASAGNVYLGVNAAAKVQDYSITAGKIQNNLTYGSDLTITGNLTVQGNTTTIDTVNLVVEDPLILLAKEQTGSPTLDIGFIGKRGTSDNIAWVWDESANSFVSVFTTSEVTNTTISISSYAAITTANISATTGNFSGNVQVANLSVVGNISGAANFSGNVTASNFLTSGIVSATGNVTGGNITTAGSVNATGNVDSGNVNTGIVSASGNITGGNLITQGLIDATGNVTGGNVNATANVTGQGAVFSGNVTADTFIGNISGNIDAGGANTSIQFNDDDVLAGSTAFTFDKTSNLVTASGNISAGNLITGGVVEATGNVIGGNLTTAGVVQATGNVIGGNITTAGNVDGGNVNAVTNVTATTVTASGNVDATTAVNANLIAGTSVQIDSTGDIILNPTGNINASGQRIFNVSDPQLAFDAATKQYVDDAVSAGIHIHPPVDVETPVALPAATYANGGNTFTVNETIAGNTVVFTTAANLQVNDQLWFDNSFNGVVGNLAYFVVSAPNTSAAVLSTAYNGVPVSNITSGSGLTESVRVNSGIGANLTANTNGALTIDGYAVSAGNRVLVYNQSNQIENGVYEVTDAGNVSAPWILTRSSDADTYEPQTSTGLDNGSYFYVEYGDTGAGESYVKTAPTGPFIFGVANIEFTQFSASQVYSANTQAGLVLNGTIFSAKVDNDTTAFDGGGNIIVKTSANLVTPNIGAATGTSLSVTGNVTGGNLNTGGAVSATGNVDSGNVNTGIVSASGNVTGANIVTGGLVTATGNITGGNLLTGGAVSATGNVDSGNVNTGIVSASGNVAAAGFTGGNVSVTGNVIAQNFIGNITGNIDAAGANTQVQFNDDDLLGASSNFTFDTATNILSVTGTIQGTTVSATGNITGGNLSTAGLITATGNITGANLILTSGNIDGPAAGRITVNASALDTDFAIDGDSTPNVFYVDAGLGTTSFGNSGAIDNAIVSFNTTNSIKMPVGNTVQRPDPAVIGMLRFNTGGDALEVYTSGGWEDVGVPAFTVITADQFAGTGACTTFTLSADSTTAATIVSINGVVQIPTTAYSVSGNSLVFTEAPEVSDEIDARLLTTTTTVTNIENNSGNAIVETLDSADTVQITGNLLPITSNTYNIGSTSLRWNELFLQGSTITLGNVVIKNTSGNTIGFFGPDGTTAGSIDTNNIDSAGISNGTSSLAVIASGGNIRANVAGGTVGLFSSTGLVITGSIEATNGFIGLDASKISNGTSNVSVIASNGNVDVNVGGNPIVTFHAGGMDNRQANGVGNIGTATSTFNTIFAKATSAQYADLAEMYVADQMIEPGTVVCFGGDHEVTICDTDSCSRVAGVISTNPSYIMNAGLAGEHVVAVALTGRVPTRVTGQVRKGDMMVSTADGRARAEAAPIVGQVIGKALADFDGIDGVIEVVVGRL